MDEDGYGQCWAALSSTVYCHHCLTSGRGCGLQKINATNSWNFALIDYFHDMSLLKEGDSVNFQKASCTLDGCVKIYTNRVDSVATETGKLLSGLADSSTSKKKGRNDGEEGEGSDGEEGDADGDGRRKPKRRVCARPGAVWRGIQYCSQP